MNKEQLETNIAALELLVSEAADKSTDFKAQLEQAKQDLADINKPELTPSQMDDVYEAIESGVDKFDWNDTDNFEIEYGINYDGKVNCDSHEFCNSDDLVQMIVDKVSKLFVEVDPTEEEQNKEAEELSDTINNAE